MGVKDLPLYLAAFAVVLGALIVVHELGHYVIARACGVKVLRFSVGFGRALWQRRFGKDGTVWAIGIFPLGGYVKMLDEREAPVDPKEAHRAFNNQSVSKRSAIVAAGPLANFLFAILLYWGLFMTGSQELLPILGNGAEGTAAARAGIANGEMVRTVDGEPVATWTDFRWLLLQKATEQESVNLEVINEQHEIAVRRLALSAAGEQGWQGDPLERLGLTFYRPRLPPVLGQVFPSGGGARAGLQPGDRVVAIDGVTVEHWGQVVSKVREAAGKTLRFDIQRREQALSMAVGVGEADDRGRRVGRIGVGVAEPQEAQREIKTFVRYGVVEAGYKALQETWEKSVFTLVMFGKMITGEVSWRNLSGPVTIADYAGQSAKAGGDYYLKFMALVSISLGVLNLLPIPVLDGGHLMYHMIEVVRRGPLSERAMEIGQQIGLSLLLALMAFAFFNDINRLLSG